MNKFLITLLAGVAVGILIAPAKGSETRKKLQKNFDDFADGLDKLVDNEKRMMKNAINTITEVKETVIREEV